MEMVSDPTQAQRLFAALRRPLGFVPTMGALHDGHLALVRAARERCAATGASIFVNPLQFGRNEDFGRYPRDLERDRALLEAEGVDLLFAPVEEQMYPPRFATRVDTGSIGAAYEGSVRPDHFLGVATVVLKLVHITAPDVLFFGQKDAQQTAVVRRMLRDLNLSVSVEIVETVREPDGLALSSRNAYLDEGARAAAPSLHRALVTLRDALSSGDEKAKAVERARKALDAAASPDYFDVVDADTFEPVETVRPGTFVIGAARFGGTRLIDNLWVRA